jgi:uncharacterized secreted protein with C-terminal beta-propeller domain
MNMNLFIQLYANKWRTVSTVLITFVIGISLGGLMWQFGGVYSPYSNVAADIESLTQFTSYEELKVFLETNSQNGIYYPYLTRGGWVLTDGMLQAESSGFSQSDTPDFSVTNIQVEGVDEADQVKTDGEYIYIVVEQTVIIVKAYPAEDALVVSRLELNQTISGIFVNANKLVVFLDEPEIYFLSPRENGTVSSETTIQVYDISNRASPILERHLVIDGWYFNSRMIGDYIYVITTYPAYIEKDDVLLPTIQSQKITVEIEASNVYYANSSDASFSFTNIVAFNIQDPEEMFSHETFLIGMACHLYVSPNNIYIVSPRYLVRDSEELSGSIIHKINVENGAITYLTDGFVPGWILNQFSMDENNGFFRIATTSGHTSKGKFASMNNVYILNENMAVVGSIEGLAPGEDLYSARFMGSKCYLVTFKKVDPLFVIDLSDVENPFILGKLKIPGYSDYIHPYDETHLIGVGKETIEANEGDFAWYQGVKLSLFDVSDVSKPKELTKYEIGDRGTDSPVLRDHHAFLFSRSKNLLVLPVLVAKIDPDGYSGEIPSNAYGEYVFQGAYVLHISLDADISVRGRITHLENDDLLKSGSYFASQYAVKRALFIDDILYTISNAKIKMHTVNNLTEINVVDLL